MYWLYRRVPAAALLTALCAAAALCRTAVPEQQKSAANASLSGTLDQLWAFVGGAVESAAGPICSELEARLHDLRTELATRNRELSTRHGALADRMEQVETHLADNIQTVESKLVSQSAELAAQNAELRSRLEAVQTGLLSRLEALQSTLLTAVPVRDCSDLPAGAGSGVHLVRPGLGRPVPAYCDLETDGGRWTVIQRRADFQPRQDFNLDWQDYKHGFGQLRQEFWWGLENLWMTTAPLDRRYELRVDMEDFLGEKRYSLYQGFSIATEMQSYALAVTNYTGTAGDSLIQRHSGMPFSTKDRDHDINDRKNCAKFYQSGWWYKSCFDASLNGRYQTSGPSDYGVGIHWKTWKRFKYSLKSVEMKIRPVA